MIRKTAAVLAVAALLLAGCEPERGGNAPRRPGAGQAQPPKPPAPEANQPGPQKDPGQCNERGERQVELQAQWSSETDAGPRKILWWHEGDADVETDLKSAKKTRQSRYYSGYASRFMTVRCGVVVGVEIVGAPSMFGAVCIVIDLGQQYPNTGERDCRAMYKVP